MKLFQSHRSEYLNGEQKRDFIYIKDLIDVLLFFMESRKNSGLYNLGTGKARTFKDLALSVFKALEISPKIEYIPIPEDIREAYQYFTEASMVKLKKAGYKGEFTPLEEGTKDYVNSYLKEKAYI
jgi:ADP-L-glycero-D-manno-heptose 6-epimerase